MNAKLEDFDVIGGAWAEYYKEQKMNTVDKVLVERGATHGDFAENAAYAQRLKNDMRKMKNWSNLTPDKQEALDNIQQKIARILNGNAEHLDNWIDISGYSALVIKKLESLK